MKTRLNIQQAVMALMVTVAATLVPTHEAAAKSQSVQLQKNEITQQQVEEAQAAVKNAESVVELVLAEQSLYDLQAKQSKLEKLQKSGRSVASSSSVE